MSEAQELLIECKHHWLIDSPNGPTSQGTCKLCGQRNEFKNSTQGLRLGPREPSGQEGPAGTKVAAGSQPVSETADSEGAT